MADNQKIYILKDTVCGGEPVKKGKIVTACKADAVLLKNLGKARDVKTEDRKTAKAETETTK
ncbi:MAG: hypothetical protein ABJJ37_27075 [Roseibium sp.]